MKRSRPIKTPLRQHLRRLRYQLLPVLVFCACVFTVGWLWEGHMTGGAVVGEVASAPMEIITLADGMLMVPQDKPWRKLDKVSPKDWLARLDPRPAELALGVMKGKLTELRADLKAVEARLLSEKIAVIDEHTQEARRLAVNVETLSLNVLDRQTRIEADRIQLQRREERHEALKKLVKDGVESQHTLADAKFRYETLKEEIKQQAKALVGAIAIHDKAQARLKVHSVNTIDRELVVHLDPIRASIATQRLRIAELEDGIQRLVIRAHRAGQIVEIFRHPGQNIRAREPVMTIEPEGSDYIISYVPEGRFIEPTIGMTVEIRAQTRPPQVALAKVDQVGPRVEPIPSHQLKNPKAPQWGVPVRIGIPKGMTLKPGQLVDVVFTPE